LRLGGLVGHVLHQLRHLSAAISRGFPRPSAWLVNRPSRQVRRNRGPREPLSALVPVPHPPARTRNPRKTCASARRPTTEREFVTEGSGVGKGTVTEHSLRDDQEAVAQ
jgi:hypothetical protein